MVNYGVVIESLKIFQKYNTDNDVGAWDDCIRAGFPASEYELSEGDRKRLEELGWKIDEFYNDWELRV